MTETSRTPVRRRWSLVGGLLAESPGRFAHFLGILASITIFISGLLLTAEVLMRFFFGVPIRGLYEVMTVLVVIIAFLGMPQGEDSGDHVRVTLVTSMLPRRVARGVRTVAMALCSGILGWMAVMLFLRAMQALRAGEYQPGLLNVPLWPSRFICALGIAALAAVYISKTITTAISVFAPVEDDEEQADEAHMTGTEQVL